MNTVNRSFRWGRRGAKVISDLGFTDRFLIIAEGSETLIEFRSLMTRKKPQKIITNCLTVGWKKMEFLPERSAIKGKKKVLTDGR